MKIYKYASDYKAKWNDFIKASKNGHFFFLREYMEYHNNKFNDFSLIITDDKEKIIAVLPANFSSGIVYSHQGLTFGGFIITDKMSTEKMLSVFNITQDFLKLQNITKLIYKCIPHIYHVTPSEEDRYALFRNNAKLIRRDVSSSISMKQKIPYSKGRRWAINKAKKEQLEILESKDYETFWQVLTEVLERNHQAKPVHSVEEIKKLSCLFPENIKLFIAKKHDKVLAGVVIYENTTVVHTQYMANSLAGRDIFALDYLVDWVINFYKNKNYFDFGISNENNGHFLNTGLIAQKEGFGARAISHDFYELML